MTLQWLWEQGACSEARETFVKEFGSYVLDSVLFEKIYERNRYDWFYWLIKRMEKTEMYTEEIKRIERKYLIEMFER